MRVLFLLSGEIRGSRTKANIEWIKECLPDIDVKCITWNRGIEYSFVDKYYDEPVATYWPENSKQHVLHRIEGLRQLKKSGADWPPLNNHDFELVTQRFSQNANNRNRWKKRHYQLLQHALGVDDFGDGYDIIVRGRFDYPYRNYDHIKLAIEYLSMSKTDIVEVRNSVDVEGHEFIEPELNWLSWDFTIIHRKEAYDTDFIWNEHKNKRLLGAESGWNQAFKLDQPEPPKLMSINGHRCKEVGMHSILDYFQRMDDLTEQEQTFYERQTEQV